MEGQIRAKRTEAEAQEAAIEAANKTSARQKHAATAAKQQVQTLENDLAEARRQQIALRSENQKLKKSLDEQVHSTFTLWCDVEAVFYFRFCSGVKPVHDDLMIEVVWSCSFAGELSEKPSRSPQRTIGDTESRIA